MKELIDVFFKIEQEEFLPIPIIIKTMTSIEKQANIHFRPSDFYNTQKFMSTSFSKPISKLI